MFGSKLPVLAKGYPALSELVEDGKNGIVFDSAEDLLNALLSIAIDFPENKVRNKNNTNRFLSSWKNSTRMCKIWKVGKRHGNVSATYRLIKSW